MEQVKGSMSELTSELAAVREQEQATCARGADRGSGGELEGARDGRAAEAGGGMGMGRKAAATGPGEGWFGGRKGCLAMPAAARDRSRFWVEKGAWKHREKYVVVF